LSPTLATRAARDTAVTTRDRAVSRRWLNGAVQPVFGLGARLGLRRRFVTAL
jgi:hypothetical protein